MPADPHPDPRDTLGDHFVALLSVRGYVTALQNSAITPSPAVSDKLYSEIRDKLDTAKQHGALWSTTLDAAIVTSVPELIGEYGRTFCTTADLILNMLAACGNAPNPAQAAAVNHTASGLGHGVADTRASIDALEAQFATFAADATVDLKALTSGDASIQAAIDVDDKDRTWLDGDIAAADQEISADKTAMAAAGIAGGVGMFIGVGMMALSAETGGLGMVVGGLVMFGSIAETASVIAVYAERLKVAEQRLAGDQRRHDDDVTQITALGLLKNTVDNLAASNAGMAGSLTQIAAWWKAVDVKLAEVQRAIADAANDAAHADWQSVVSDLSAAKTFWFDLAEFASRMQTSASQTQSYLVRFSDGAATPVS